MTLSNVDNSSLLVDEATIVSYLQDNPDFFNNHPQLLSQSVKESNTK